MKLLKLRYNLGLIFFSFVIFSCTTDTENYSHSYEKSILTKEFNTTITSKITNDIENKNYYTGVSNPYDYSAEYFKNFNKQHNFKILNGQKTSIDNESDFEIVLEYYSSLGYDKEKLIEVNNQVQNFLENHKGNPSIESLHNAGFISKSQSEILNSYFLEFNSKTSDAEFSKINSIFEYHIVNSNLSENEKMGLLTIFNMTENVLLEDNIKEYLFTEMNLNKGEELDCAGDVVIGMALGAAVGNGGGAVVGILGGLWSAYRNGCMD